MVNENYLEIKKTTPYYNFFKKVKFPSTHGILAILVFLEIGGTLLSFWINVQSVENLKIAFTFAVFGFLTPSLVSVFLLRYFLLRGDRIFYFRRILSLSLFSATIMVLSLFTGAMINNLYPPFLFPKNAFYMGLFFIFPLRFLVIYSMTSAVPLKKFISVSFEPFLVLIISTQILSFPFSESIFSYSLSMIIGFLYCNWLLRYIEKKGFALIKAPPLPLFRSFLEVMLEGDNTSLEEHLEKIGTWNKLEVATIGFRSQSSKKLKGVFIISNFHPGPFKNVGSSNLPSLIKEVVEEKTGAIAAVPHGISGHEMNLVSQEQNEKVVSCVLGLIEFKDFKSMGSSFYRGSYNYASSSCQFFGDYPLITLTLSPRDMEDIPLEAASKIRFEIKDRYEKVILVDSHNSIGKITVLNLDDVEKLKEAALISLKAAGRERGKFQFAASKVDLSELTPSQGVGPGGGTIFMFKNGQQIAVYLVFDSNNMRKGLREELQSYLKKLGVSDSEILTTDTHVISGLAPSRLGYIPFGENIPLQILQDRIKKAVRDAKNRLEWAESSINITEIKVKVLGLNIFKQFTNLIYMASKKVVFSLIPLMILSLLVFSIIFM